MSNVAEKEVELKQKSKNIRLKSNVSIMFNSAFFKPGDVFEIDKDNAKRLLGKGAACEYHESQLKDS